MLIIITTTTKITTRPTSIVMIPPLKDAMNAECNEVQHYGQSLNGALLIVVLLYRIFLNLGLEYN